MSETGGENIFKKRILGAESPLQVRPGGELEPQHRERKIFPFLLPHPSNPEECGMAWREIPTQEGWTGTGITGTGITGTGATPELQPLVSSPGKNGLKRLKSEKSCPGNHFMLCRIWGWQARRGQELMESTPHLVPLSQHCFFPLKSWFCQRIGDNEDDSVNTLRRRRLELNYLWGPFHPKPAEISPTPGLLFHNLKYFSHRWKI